MQIIPIKTHALIPGKDRDIMKILDQYLGENSGQFKLTEGSVLAATSKIVSICEGRFVPMEGTDKNELIASEAQMYIPRTLNRYNVTVTIKNNILGAGAGVDESNGNGYYILWPEDVQKSANAIREHIAKRLGLRNFGVVITDSKTTSMRWGVTGIALAHSGFLALKDYIGTPDIFGRNFEFEKLNIADCLATAGVLAMGEGKEQTPLAVISDIPLITFQERNPSDEELAALQIHIDDDVYGDFLKNAPWKEGKK